MLCLEADTELPLGGAVVWLRHQLLVKHRLVVFEGTPYGAWPQVVLQCLDAELCVRVNSGKLRELAEGCFAS